MELKNKMPEISKKLKELLNEQENDIDLKIHLSSEYNSIFQLIKIFVQAIDNNFTDNDIINMIFINGLIYELNKIKNLKEYIYNMGNMEMLADENNIGLSNEERRIASSIISPPKTIDEYWELGYITINCPLCNKRAVWNEETDDYQCIDGCRKSGVLNGNN